MRSSSAPQVELTTIEVSDGVEAWSAGTVGHSACIVANVVLPHHSITLASAKLTCRAAKNYDYRGVEGNGMDYLWREYT